MNVEGERVYFEKRCGTPHNCPTTCFRLFLSAVVLLWAISSDETPSAQARTSLDLELWSL